MYNHWPFSLNAERLGLEPRRRLPVDRLAICSVTTPAPLQRDRPFCRSGDKVTIKPCENNKNAYLTSLKFIDRQTLTETSMKKVLILSVFAFFALAMNAQSDASASTKSTTSGVTQTKDGSSSTKNVGLGGSSASAKTTKSDEKKSSKSSKSSCGKAEAACCSSKSSQADAKGAACCSGKTAESCSKGTKEEGEAPKKD